VGLGLRLVRRPIRVVREYNEFSLMETKAAISVEEYLRTSYEYDPEYVDGELVERSLPTIQHGRSVALTLSAFVRTELQCHLYAALDVRIPVRDTRWRVPDLVVFADEVPATKYPTAPPVAVIEILSPEDSLHDLLSKFDEYVAWGIPNAWLLDPEHRRVYSYVHGDLLKVDSIEFPDRGFRLPASEIFG
jgi:Uma2 family endonuclease